MLDEILAHKVGEIQMRQAQTPTAELRRRIVDARPVRRFRDALTAPTLSLIAEVKRCSPSYGVFRADFDPITLARSYVANGARAVSVLADKTFFGMGPEVVRSVACDCKLSVPVLSKDFVVSDYQVYEARAAGADAVLLIVRAVESHQLSNLISLSHELGLDALVEVFTEAEADLALNAGARIVGVNTRDLATFRVDRRRATKVRSALPASVLTVSESGIDGREAMLEAEQAGFDAVLVGETLLRAFDPGARVRELLCRPPREDDKTT